MILRARPIRGRPGMSRSRGLHPCALVAHTSMSFPFLDIVDESRGIGFGEPLRPESAVDAGRFEEA